MWRKKYEYQLLRYKKNKIYYAYNSKDVSNSPRIGALDSTHSYNLAKYFEVKRNKNNHVLFHSLYRDGNEVLSDTKEYFSKLDSNKILSELQVINIKEWHEKYSEYVIREVN